jgi:hypothetical protein
VQHYKPESLSITSVPKDGRSHVTYAAQQAQTFKYNEEEFIVSGVRDQC